MKYFEFAESRMSKHIESTTQMFQAYRVDDSDVPEKIGHLKHRWKMQRRRYLTNNTARF